MAALTVAAYLLVLILSAAIIYNQATRKIPSRLNAGEAPKSRLGIVEVKKNNLGSRLRAGGVDVVFVHGLGSNPDTTWKARTNHQQSNSQASNEYVCWVTDFLPDDISSTERENVRLFFYNYDSYWQRDAVQKRLHGLGKEMLHELQEIRKDWRERERYLVFVGHSYGGLVIKQALIQAKIQANQDISHADIIAHTKAILFLGTPHRGSNFSRWGKRAAGLLWPLSSNPSILGELTYDSLSLQDLHSNFTRAAKEVSSIINFYETRKSRILKVWCFQWEEFCVPEQSATFVDFSTKVENISLDTDHYGLNKFASRMNGYDRICKELKRVIEPGVSQPQHSPKTEFTTEEQDCLRCLFLTDPAEDRTRLQRRKGDRAKGTCEWMLKTDEVVHWLEAPEAGEPKRSDILWLHGNPGTGKTTMAITMTELLQKQPSFTSGNKILAYFFCDSNNETQRTAISILRGLIYCVVIACPVLMKHLLRKYVERKESLYNSFDALWNILCDMSQESSVDIYCIIDALDECDSESQQAILRQITQTFLSHKTVDTASSLPHILITSRPYQEIRQHLHRFINRDLASYSAVKNDLTTMIQEKVKDLAEMKGYPDSLTKEVSRILEEKAEGTFLWIGIACDALARPEVQSRNTVRKLEEMPRGLHKLYQQLLNTAMRNNDDDDGEGATRDKMVDMLRFVAFARRPLRVIELATLCELYPDYDEARRLQFTKDHVDLCRLMIVVQDEHVRLLHKSVKDFLVGESLGCDKLRTNADMANRCIDHILHCAGISNTKFSYLEYADEYWPEHARRADTEYAIDQHQAPLFEKNSSAWAEWLRRYNMRKLYDFDRLDEGFTVLHAAAKWNVLPLLCWGLNIPAGSAGLEHDTEGPYNDAKWATLREKTPLEEAAQAGSLSVMHILLRRMMVGSKISKRVLHAAARNSNKGKDIMALLLDQRGEQVQITQDVVVAAAGNEQSGTDIMALLLDRRGDQIQITQDIVKAAAGNKGSGIDIMALLDRQGDLRS